MLPYGFELEQTSVTYSINAGTAVYSQNSDLLDGLDSSEFLQLVASQTITGQPVWQNTILGTATYSLDGNLLNGTSNYLRNDIDDIDLGNITSSNTTPTFTWHTTGDGNSLVISRSTTNAEGIIKNTVDKPVSSKALQFNGANDYVTVADDPSLTVDAFTVAFWMDTASTDARYFIFDSYNSVKVEGIQIWQHNAGAGSLNCRVFVDGVWIAIISNNPPPAGKAFVVFARDLTGGCSMWINNVLQSDTKTLAGEIDGSNLQIGTQWSFASDYNGILDEIAFFNRVITPTERATQYAGGTGKSWDSTTTGLIMLLRFDDGEGTNASDATGNGHNGTLVNSPVWVNGLITTTGGDVDTKFIRMTDGTGANIQGNLYLGNGLNRNIINAKIINFAIEGVTKATWTATGLGIGTDNARTLLDVNDDITVTGDIIAGDSNGTGLKEQTGVDGLEIDNNGDGTFTKSLDVQGDNGIDSTYNVDAATFTATVYMESPLFKGSTIQPLTDTGNVHIGTSAANGTYFESDGTMVFKGKATVFRDIKMYLTSGKRGANAKPDFDEVNVGYLFPQNDASEILYLIVQIPSGYKEGEDLIPHIHWLQTSISTATFKIDYMWHNQGASTTSFTTLQCDEGEFNYTSGAMHQHSNFPAISGTGKTIGSSLQFRLYRDDNFVSGDVLTWEFDLHYEKNTAGSRTSTSK